MPQQPPIRPSAYDLVRFIDGGGFGQVWEARDREGQPCALKFLRLAPDLVR